MHYKTLQCLTITLAISLLYAALTSRLSLYIHPRYIIFSVTSVGTGLLLFSIALIVQSSRNNPVHLDVIRSIPLYLLAGCALFLAPSALSQSLAVSRSSVSQQNNISETKHSTLDTFSSDLTRFSIADWNNLLASRPSNEQIAGKQAALEGFLYTDESGQLFVARFRLTCCAVDAMPLAVPLTASPELAKIESGDWVTITGVFNNSTDILHPWQLAAETVIEIEEPDEPYIF
jgi:uncharacterized repeat protein (TIGR03943 family)